MINIFLLQQPPDGATELARKSFNVIFTRNNLASKEIALNLLRNLQEQWSTC